MNPHRAFAVEQLPHQRMAGVLVTLGGGVVPQEAVGDVGIIRIHQPSAMPVAAAFVLAHQRHVAGFAPVNFRKPMVELCHHLGPTIERRFKHHHAIAKPHLALRIAAIESLHPHDRNGRTDRPPVMPARLHGHAAGAHILGGGPDVHALHLTVRIPHLNAAREKLDRRLVRIRRMHALHQNVPAIGRHIIARENRRPPQRLAAGGARIDQRELRGQIIIKEIFVVFILEQIWIRQHRRFAWAGFLHHRPNGRTRWRGSGPAFFRHGKAQ